MVTTSPDNLWSPDGSSPFDPIATFAAMQQSTQDALETRANTYRGTGAERVAFGSQAEVGQVWVDTDGAQEMYTWNGNDWVVNPKKNPIITWQQTGTNPQPSTITVGGTPITPSTSPIIKCGLAQGSTEFFPQFNNTNVFPTITFDTPFPGGLGAVIISDINTLGTSYRGPQGYVEIARPDAFRVIYKGLTANFNAAFFWMAIGW